MRNSVYKNKRSADLEDSTNSYEDIYMNEEMEMREPTCETSTSEPNRSGCRGHRLVVVCLLILVVILLAVVAILWFKLTPERDQEHRKTDVLQQNCSQFKKNIDTPGWRYFNSSIYYISTEKKNWTESRQDCKEKGEDLVIINSRDEQDFVGMLRRVEDVWIGANDRETEKVWKWVDDTTISTGLWKQGEPNNVSEEDCAVSGYPTELENWYYVSCDWKYYWICEKMI